MLNLIDDPDDPRVAAYRDVRERDLVGRQNLFVAEGEVVLRALVRSPLVEPVSVLLAQKRVAAQQPILSQLDDAVPVYCATDAVMDQIAGFPIHRGILALGRRRTVPSVVSLLADLTEQATVLVLCGIANHDNMGGLFRNAAAFGAQAVFLDAECCDPLYRKAIRVSVGAALLVPFAQFERGQNFVSLLRTYQVRPLALSPSGVCRLSLIRPSGRTAVILGTEGPGLSAEVMAECETVAIPMATDFDSLNVATSAGIVLHHMSQYP